MMQLRFRRALTSGVVVSLILAAGITGRSDTSLPVFTYVLVMGIAATGLVVLTAAAIARRCKRFV